MTLARRRTTTAGGETLAGGEGEDKGDGRERVAESRAVNEFTPRVYLSCLTTHLLEETMHTRIPGMIALAAVLVAAAPAPRPVITIDGVAAAVKLAPTTKAAIEKQIVALNEGLVKVVDLQQKAAKGSAAEQAQAKMDMGDLHAHCMALHDAIIKQLDPAQREAFFTYLHAQMKAAGIDMSQFDHDGMKHDGMSHDHGDMHAGAAHAGHGG